MNNLLYCSSAWSNTSAKNINKRQLVQNFACRIVTNSKKFDHISPKRREPNWLPVKEHLFLEIQFWCTSALIIYPYLTCAINLVNDQIYMNVALVLESSSKYRCIIPPCTGQRTFHYRGAKLWNDLDNNTKQMPSLKNFKNKLKKDMLDRLYS